MSQRPKKKEILGLTLILFFKTLILYYIYGGSLIYPRGDAIVLAYLIILSRKNFPLTLSIGYPKFFTYLWAVPLYLIPLPDIYSFNNYLLAIFLINAYLSVILYYLLAKQLFDENTALFSTAIWNFVSGFTWLYYFIEPPSKLGGLGAFIIRASFRIGYYSGAYVSHTLIGGHILSRLPALNAFLAAVYFLVKYLRNNGNEILYLTGFTASYIAACCGHIAEAFLISMMTAATLAIEGTQKAKKMLLSAITGGTISFLFLKLTSSHYFRAYNYNIYLTIICFSLPLGIVGGYILFTALKALSKTISKYSKILLSAYIYYYGLSLIAFTQLIQKGGALHWSHFTHWYIPPAEWGFTGILSTIAAVLIVKNNWSTKGLKIIVLYLILQSILLAIINLSNIYFIYTTIPVYIEPTYYTLFLSMIAGHLAKLTENKPKYRAVLITLLLVLMLIPCSIDTALSAYYWKYFNGRAPHQRMPWTQQDLELLNYLYKLEVKHGYAVTFKAKTIPPAYVVYLAGFTPLPEPVRQLYITACSWKELSYLYSHFPVDIIMLDHEGKYFPRAFPLLNMLNELQQVFTNKKYTIYKIQYQLSETTSNKAFISCSKILFNGTCIITANNTKIVLNNSGLIEPLSDGWIKISTKTNKTLSIFRPKIYIKGLTILEYVRAIKYFKELGGCVKKLSIKGEVLLQVEETFCLKKIYINYFKYSGKYSAETSKISFIKVIAGYAKSHWVSPINSAKTPQGTLWTITFFLVIDIFMLGKWRGRRKVIIISDKEVHQAKLFYYQKK